MCMLSLLYVTHQGAQGYTRTIAFTAPRGRALSLGRAVPKWGTQGAEPRAGPNTALEATGHSGHPGLISASDHPSSSGSKGRHRDPVACLSREAAFCRLCSDNLRPLMTVISFSRKNQIIVLSPFFRRQRLSPSLSTRERPGRSGRFAAAHGLRSAHWS